MEKKSLSVVKETAAEKEESERVRVSQNDTGFLNFFDVSSVNPQDELDDEGVGRDSLKETDEMQVDFGKYTNYEMDEEDEVENTKINIHEMDGISQRQKFMLMKARMAAKQSALEAEEEEE